MKECTGAFGGKILAERPERVHESFDRPAGSGGTSKSAFLRRGKKFHNNPVKKEENPRKKDYY